MFALRIILLFSVVFFSCLNGKKAIVSSTQNVTTNRWSLIKMNDEMENVLDSNQKYIALEIPIDNEGNGKFIGFVGCNTLSGNYAITPKGKKIKFLDIITTKKACKDLSNESKFNKYLIRINSYEASAKFLKLYDGAELLLTFEAKNKL